MNKHHGEMKQCLEKLLLSKKEIPYHAIQIVDVRADIPLLIGDGGTLLTYFERWLWLKKSLQDLLKQSRRHC